MSLSNALIPQTPARRRAASAGIVGVPGSPSSPPARQDFQSPLSEEGTPGLEWDNTPQGANDGPATPLTIRDPIGLHIDPRWSNADTTPLRRSKSTHQLHSPSHQTFEDDDTGHPTPFQDSRASGWLFGQPNGAEAGRSVWSFSGPLAHPSLAKPDLLNIDFNFSTPAPKAGRKTRAATTTTPHIAQPQPPPKGASTEGPSETKVLLPTATTNVVDPRQNTSVEGAAVSAAVVTEPAIARSIKGEDGVTMIKKEEDEEVQIPKVEHQNDGATRIGEESLAMAHRLIRVIMLNPALGRILHIDTIKRLNENPGRCAASLVKDPGTRCTNSACWPVADTEQLLQDLSGPESSIHDTTVWHWVDKIIAFGLCSPHRKVSSNHLNDLRDSIALPDEGGDHGQRSAKFSDEDGKIATLWMKILLTAGREAGATPAPKKEEPEDNFQRQSDSNQRSRTQTERRQAGSDEARLESLDDVTKKVGRDPVAGAMMTRRRTDQTIVTNAGLHRLHMDVELYRPKTTMNLSVAQAIRRKLTEPLTPSLQDSGFIYAYWYPQEFGYVKVGWTRRDVETRLKEWESQCRHAAENIYQSEQEVGRRVPNAHRVEALVHAELKDVRLLQRNCQVCHRNHIEWLYVRADHAKRVIKKWSDFMINEDPYGPPGEDLTTIPPNRISWTSKKKTLTQGDWILKKEFFTSGRIEELCQALEAAPMKPLAAHKPTPKGHRGFPWR